MKSTMAILGITLILFGGILNYDHLYTVGHVWLVGSILYKNS